MPNGYGLPFASNINMFPVGYDEIGNPIYGAGAEPEEVRQFGDIKPVGPGLPFTERRVKYAGYSPKLGEYAGPPYTGERISRFAELSPGERGAARFYQRPFEETPVVGQVPVDQAPIPTSRDIQIPPREDRVFPSGAFYTARDPQSGQIFSTNRPDVGQEFIQRFGEENVRVQAPSEFAGEEIPGGGSFYSPTGKSFAQTVIGEAERRGEGAGDIASRLTGAPGRVTVEEQFEVGERERKATHLKTRQGQIENVLAWGRKNRIPHGQMMSTLKTIIGTRPTKIEEVLVEDVTAGRKTATEVATTLGKGKGKDKLPAAPIQVMEYFQSQFNMTPEVALKTWQKGQKDPNKFVQELYREYTKSKTGLAQPIDMAEFGEILQGYSSIIGGIGDTTPPPESKGKGVAAKWD